jgi:iron complex outermembrane receptor protein
MRRVVKIACLVSASAISLGIGGIAQASEETQNATTASAAAPEQVAESASTGIADIVVTARRKEEALQDVPIAISALSTADIERKSLQSIEDLRNVAPGLNVSGLSRDKANFYIRGQQPGALTAGARNVPGVATYFAEVPTDVAGPGMMYDLENVQILKGPQGTLFGRNTTGGAVLFEPHRPEWKNGGYAEVTLGNYNLRQFNGVLNVQPAPDVLAIRLATEIVRRDGFTQSIITGQKQDDRNYEALRATFLLTPTADIENETIIDYRNKHNNGSGMVITALNPDVTVASIPVPTVLQGLLGGTTSLPLNLGSTGPSVTCLVRPGTPSPAGCPAGGAVGAYLAANQAGSFFLIAPASTYQQILDTQAEIGPRKNQNNFLGLIEEQTLGITNKTKITLSDALTLKNIISFRKTRNNEALNYTGTPLPLLNQFGPADPNERWTFGQEQFTEELQLQGNVDSANLTYILGGYYEKVKPGIQQSTLGVAGGSPSIRFFSYDDHSEALFGHVEWNPIEIVTLSGGLRKSWDHRSVTQSVVNPDGSCNQIDLMTGKITCPLFNAADFSAWTYDGTISVKPTDGVMVYGAFRHGYKSGGLNTPAAPGPASDPLLYASYDPETVDDFEIGAKADFKLGTVPVRLNLAAFKDNYKNQQISQLVTYLQPDGTPAFTSNIQSIASSSIKGVEAQLTIEPVKYLQLNGFVSYLDAHPKDSLVDAAGNPVTIEGRQLPNQPKWKYGISGVFTLPVDQDVGNIALSADWSWQDTWHPSLTPTLVDPKPAYGVLNMRLAWDAIANSRFDAALFVNNVTDKVYALGGYPVNQLGFDSTIYGEPRMWGFSMKYHFGE